jgi:hypothetical protein
VVQLSNLVSCLSWQVDSSSGHHESVGTFVGTLGCRRRKCTGAKEQKYFISALSNPCLCFESKRNLFYRLVLIFDCFCIRHTQKYGLYPHFEIRRILGYSTNCHSKIFHECGSNNYYLFDPCFDSNATERFSYKYQGTSDSNRRVAQVR